MKTKACAFVTGCLLFLAGSMCLAADAAGNGGMSANDMHAAETGAAKDKQQLRVWINSIKPAAGPNATTANTSGNEYWRQTVRRENRGSMHE